MKDCSTCRFNINKLLCAHPDNYQPQIHQYMKMKSFSHRFYPKPPAWCKGYESVNVLYCITCGRDVRRDDVIDPNVHIIPLVEGREVVLEICEGILAQSPPPSITEDDWSFIFAHEPSGDEMELIKQEAQILEERNEY